MSELIKTIREYIELADRVVSNGLRDGTMSIEEAKRIAADVEELIGRVAQLEEHQKALQ